MIILFASDPLYADLNELLTIRAQWINACCHFDLNQCPEPERRAFVAWLDGELAEMFAELTR